MLIALVGFVEPRGMTHIGHIDTLVNYIFPNFWEVHQAFKKAAEDIIVNVADLVKQM